MADGGGHPANLAVFPLEQLQTDPAVRHVFAETNRRIARWGLWLWLKQPRATRQSLSFLDYYSARQFTECFRRGDAFHLHPILAFVGVARFEQAGVPSESASSRPMG